MQTDKVIERAVRRDVLRARATGGDPEREAAAAVLAAKYGQPVFAGGDTAPVTYPLGGTSVTGSRVTIDAMTRPPTRVSAIVRDLVAANEGYFAEELFRTPGMTVQGGAILYQEQSVGDHFLDPNQSLAPRAPGAESPTVGFPRQDWLIAKVESWAGKFEVTDEARRRNDVVMVQDAMRRIANTLADQIQTRAITAANAFVTSKGRVVTGIDWGQAYSSGVPNADPTTLPQRDFALALTTFINDKTGIRPDRLILNPTDAFLLDVVYGEKLPALLQRYGLTLRVTPEQTQGQALLVKAGQMGFMAFEKPLDTEVGRGPTGTWKDIYAVEATPVLVVNDATAVLRINGINPTP